MDQETPKFLTSDLTFYPSTLQRLHIYLRQRDVHGVSHTEPLETPPRSLTH